jgi:hypothetical protein
MLTENRNVRQERGSRRRWFEADGLELIVWYQPSGTVEGFQLCHDRPDGQFALTWRTGVGFAYDRVDTGDTTPFKNETPVLRPDGAVPWADVTALFQAHSAQIEESLRKIVLQRLAAKN